jgi:hypothetical protein
MVMFFQKAIKHQFLDTMPICWLSFITALKQKKESNYAIFNHIEEIKTR